MTREQRQDISNGLWLCSNCAKLIDRDPDKFTADLLRSWKGNAEAAAAQEQGRKLPSERDATDQLTMALAGHAGRFIPSAIANAHAASVKVLEAVDPRFRIETKFADNKAEFVLHPRETVPMSAEVTGEDAKVWAEGMDKVVNRAIPVSLPLKGVKLTGSPLLEFIVRDAFDGDAKFVIQPHGRPAVARLRAPGVNSELVEDFVGQVFAGREAIRFELSAFGNLMNLEIVLKKTGDLAVGGAMGVGFDLGAWNGKHVLQLPYFDRLKNLFECMGPDGGLEFELSVEGNPVVLGKRAQFDQDIVPAVRNLIGYINRTRTIAKHTGAEIRVDLFRSFAAEEHERLEEVAASFEGRRIVKGNELSRDPECSLVIPDNGEWVRQAARQREFSEFQLQFPSDDVTAFGASVTLPPQVMIFRNTKLSIRNSRKVKVGRKVVLRFERGPDFECEQRFVDGDVADAAAFLSAAASA